MLIPGQSASHIFYIRVRSLAVAPDIDPTAVVLRNGMVTAIGVTMSDLSDGGWLASFTVPANWVTGDRVFLRIQAVRDALPISTTILLGQVDTRLAQLASALAKQSDLDKLLKIHGLIFGVSVTARDSTEVQAGYRRTSDNAIAQSISTDSTAATKTITLLP